MRLGTVDPTIRFHAAAIANANGQQARAAELLQASYERNRYISFAVRQERDTLANDLGLTR